MMNTVTWLSILLHLVSCYGQNWCDSKFDCSDLGTARKHILCNETSLPDKKYCQSESFDVKSQILELHNKVRRKISTGSFGQNNGFPKACPMSDLVWDDVLALMADRLGMGCMTNEGACIGTTEFKEVGQNLNSKPIPEPTDTKEVVKELFDRWSSALLEANEAKYDVRDYRPGSWDEGTQIAWAQTTRIGCALVKYKTQRKIDHSLICNYAPKGNIEHKEVYATDNCQPITVPPPTTTTTASTTTGRTTTPRITITARTTTASTTGTTSTTTDIATSSLTFTDSSIGTSHIVITMTTPSTVASSNVTEANSIFLPLLHPSSIPVVEVVFSRGKVCGNSNLLGAVSIILLTLCR